MVIAYSKVRNRGNNRKDVEIPKIVRDLFENHETVIISKIEKKESRQGDDKHENKN